MANNEMPLVLTKPGGYLLATILGDGRDAKLMMLDPSRDDPSQAARVPPLGLGGHDWSRFAETDDGV